MSCHWAIHSFSHVFSHLEPSAHGSHWLKLQQHLAPTQSMRSLYHHTHSLCMAAMAWPAVNRSQHQRMSHHALKNVGQCKQPPGAPSGQRHCWLSKMLLSVYSKQSLPSRARSSHGCFGLVGLTNHHESKNAGQCKQPRGMPSARCGPLNQQ